MSAPKDAKETRKPGVYFSERETRNVLEDSKKVFREILLLKPDILCDIFVDEVLRYAVEMRGDEGRNKEPFIFKTYGINGVAFDGSEMDCEEHYVEMEIVDEKKNECVKRELVETATEYVGANASQRAITIREAHNGVIINSNVFLPEKNWHTIMRVGGKQDLCMVCAAVFADYKGHIHSKGHKANLQEYLPLDHYHGNVVRKVNGKYHCGVCNETNAQAQFEYHFGTKSHEQRLKDAEKSVSDIMDLRDSPQRTSQPAAVFQEDDDLKGFDEYPIQLTRPGGYADESSSDDSDKGPTYAAVARLPKKMPKCTEIDLGECKAWFQTDSWHMIVCPEPNKFYCMPCNSGGSIRRKTRHCTKKEHLDNLDKCNLMREYEHHLVRRVSSNLVHCGHCNNLRLISDIDTHLAYRHPRITSKSQSDAQKAKGTANSSPAGSLTTVNIQSSASSASRASTASPASPINLPKPNAAACLPVQNMPALSNKNLALQRNQTICPIHRIDGISNMMLIEIFGARMMIPTLHFHMVIHTDGFHCCLCALYISKEALPGHLMDRYHLDMLKKTQFLVNFNLNLVRVVRDGFHCGICNALFPYDQIIPHIGQLYHISFLNNAVVPMIPPRPDAHQMFIPPQSNNHINPPQYINHGNYPPHHHHHQINTSSQSSYHANIPPQLTNHNGPPQSSNQTNHSSPYTIHINNFPQSNNPNNIPLQFSNQINILPHTNIPTNIPSQPSDPIKSTPQSSNPTNIPPLFSNQIKCPTQSSSPTNITLPYSNPIKSCPQSSNPYSILDEASDNDDSLNYIEPEKDDFSQSVPTDTEVESDVEDTENTFDVEDFLYVKIDDAIFKIGACSYNTLVAIGDGNRHCFLCSEILSKDELGEHVSRRYHQENLETNKFLDTRKTSLLRQRYIRYHCGVCNVIVLGSDLNLHLTWPVHVYNEQIASVTKKKEKRNMKDKMLYELTLQQEKIYNGAAEPQMTIRSFKISKEVTKKYMMVLVNGGVAKIEWHAWNGFLRNGEGLRCCLCQTTVDNDPAEHANNEDHISATENFLDMYLPNLIRLTFGDKLHCVTCNREMEKHDSVFGHICSKCHKKIYKSILKSSAASQSFVDCSLGVFSLDNGNK